MFISSCVTLKTILWDTLILHCNSTWWELLTSKMEWGGWDGSTWLWLKLREKWSFLILWAEFSPHLSQSLITGHIFKYSVLILIGHLKFIATCNCFIFSKAEIEILSSSESLTLNGDMCVCVLVGLCVLCLLPLLKEFC